MYVRDRFSVPRDMNIWSGKRLRQALTEYADSVLNEGGEGTKGWESRLVRVRLRDRRDQDPVPFVGDTQKVPAMFK
jgi:hypothetical protein